MSTREPWRLLVMLRAATPGLFVSQNSVACDPNTAFAQCRYHDLRQAARPCDSHHRVYGVGSLLSPVPRVKKTSDARPSVTANYPLLRSPSFFRIVGLSKPRGRVGLGFPFPVPQQVFLNMCCSH
jgi:hypothetical protein